VEPEYETPPDTPPKPKPSELKRSGGILTRGSSTNILLGANAPPGVPSADVTLGGEEGGEVKKPQVARGPLAGMDLGALRGGLKKRA
jgi:hypothetical protein